jgi:glycosyltransferase involved in cell wall biosynthesis
LPPRLLYLGDVAVESSYHGSTLLYRLLQRYSADRLTIVEGNLFPARTDRRLPGVTHHTLQVGSTRILNTRIHDWYSRWLLRGANARVATVRRLLGGFTPDAVLTVMHGYSWVTAARLAKDAGVPLYVIVHDDWPRIVAPQLQPAVDRMFGEIYRQAAARFCTSPVMQEDYARRYGVSGTVLLPYRAADAPVFPGVAERLGGPSQAPVFAFAGTINSPGYAQLLRSVAGRIAKHRGELLIFGPLATAQAAAWGLDLPNIRLGGLLKADELLLRLRAEADVLFVPMSFAPEDRDNMRMGFPSKLTDYTAVGLPLLIAGPPDCSAVRWAEAHPGVAEVVTAADPDALGPAIDRLCGDSQHRIALANTAQQVGNRDFSAATAETIFQTALQSGARH